MVSLASTSLSNQHGFNLNILRMAREQRQHQHDNDDDDNDDDNWSDDVDSNAPLQPIVTVDSTSGLNATNSSQDFSVQENPRTSFSSVVNLPLRLQLPAPQSSLLPTQDFIKSVKHYTLLVVALIRN